MLICHLPECNFRDTGRAFDVESVDPQSQMVHVVHIFLPRVELPALVDVLAARRASHVAWGHQSNGKGLVSGLFGSRDLRRIEIRRVIFIQHFPLGHF